jgi:hypothetical protein
VAVRPVLAGPDQGVQYEIVVGPRRPKNRTVVIDGTGQSLYPAIEFEDGSWYRAESKEMARTISEGRLMAMQQGRVSTRPVRVS